LTTPFQAGAGFRTPNSSWSSYAFRTVYFFTCIGIWSLALISIFPVFGRTYTLSSTASIVTSFYSVFLAISNLIYAVYFLQGKTTTTIIPCISCVWYKVYTILLLAMMLIMVIFSALETNRLPNGTYASDQVARNLACGSQSRWLAVSARDAFLLSFTNNATTPQDVPFEAFGNVAISNEKYGLYDLTRYCVGQPGGI
jgi:hypothetical protein